MSGRNPSRSFLTPAEVQPPAITHNYPFGNGQNTNSEVLEEEAELYELRLRGKEKTRKSTSVDRLDEIVFITKDIVEGDTLNAIALRYCCSVADIKRANNFISEQDFFALKSIKIPVKKFRFLIEKHLQKDVPTSPSAPALLSCEPQRAEDLDSISHEKSAGNFLKEVDRDLEQILKCTDTKRENLNQVVSALSTEQICYEPDRKGRKPDPYYGADWGMGWWTAVVIMLVVGVITPVFYLLYYEYLMEADVSHHGSPATTTLNVEFLSQEVHDVHHLKSNNFPKENSHLTQNAQTNLHRPIT